MKKEKYGRILNVISTSVKQPIKDPMSFQHRTVGPRGSRSAKPWAGELGPFGITVNDILPGATLTGRLSSLIELRAKNAGIASEKEAQEWLKEIPLARFAQASEIAAAAAFLASPAASYINGINLPVDGGEGITCKSGGPAFVVPVIKKNATY